MCSDPEKPGRDRASVVVKRNKITKILQLRASGSKPAALMERQLLSNLPVGNPMYACAVRLRPQITHRLASLPFYQRHAVPRRD